MEQTRIYEGMFMVDAGQGDFGVASAPVRGILGRSRADVLSIAAWDERRLAYEIKGRKRALYVLTYFRLDPSLVREIEHDCRLSENIIRALIIRRDDLTDEQVLAGRPQPAAQTHEPAADKGARAEAPKRAAPPSEEPAAAVAAPPAADAASEPPAAPTDETPQPEAGAAPPVADAPSEPPAAPAAETPQPEAGAAPAEEDRPAAEAGQTE